MPGASTVSTQNPQNAAELQRDVASLLAEIPAGSGCFSAPRNGLRWLQYGKI